jgi:hypothetical protein
VGIVYERERAYRNISTHNNFEKPMSIENKKAANDLIKSLSAEQLNITFEFDDDPDNTSTLEVFLYHNLLDDDVNSITIEDAKNVIDLQIGSEIYLPYGFGFKMKRIS